MSSTFATIKPALLALAIAAGVITHCDRARAQGNDTATALVAGGCFWCVEADFERVQGVEEVVSGFAGGDVDNPTYKQVTGGDTGHLEVAQIRYDPNEIGYDQILDLFLRSIDPFDAGGQFCDRGESYTTAIFAQTEAQRQAAEAAVAEAEAELGREIVTPVRGPAEFWPADDYHQDYYKSEERVLTRFGWIDKADAYKRYRDACGRDQRVREIWGADAPFVGG
jgi:peptide-methionine (S)-S-oxide reductase